MSDQMTAVPEKKLIVFQLKEKEYVISVEDVRSIERLLSITRVPGTPNYVKGVLNLRGVVIPVVDLKLRFGIDEEPYTDRTRVIILAIDGHEMGLLVDGANDVIDVFDDDIHASKNIGSHENEEFIEGVLQYNKRIMILLDIRKVLEEQLARS